MISSFLHIISQALCRVSYGSFNMVVSADPLGGAEGLRWAGNGSPFSRSCLGTCCVQANKSAGTSAQHPIPSPDVQSSWSCLSRRLSLHVRRGHLASHTVPPYFSHAGHWAHSFQVSWQPRVCPACLQGAVGRSVARQNTELHGQGRQRCPESPALSPPQAVC